MSNKTDSDNQRLADAIFGKDSPEAQSMREAETPGIASAIAEIENRNGVGIRMLITDTLLVPRGLSKPRIDDGFSSSGVREHALTVDGQPLGRLPEVGEKFRLAFNRPEIHCERLPDV